MIESLQDREWKEFKITEIFSCIKRGKRQKEDDRIAGDIAYYSASIGNNGLTDFISNPSFIFKNNAIIYSTFGDAYFVPANFSTSDEITILYSEKLNKYNALFIVQALKQNHSKYCFGRKAFSNKITKDKIMLPVNSAGEPDYEFMEGYIKELKDKLKQRYKEHVLNSICELRKELKLKNSWKDFALTDIFIPEKGNQNNMSSLTEGDLPLVSAKKVDNGYKMFATRNEKKIFPANIITLNNDGDGGAGIAYYQPTKHLLDSHVTALIPKDKNLSKNILLYLSTAITNQRAKFGHGYSINSNRLKIFRFMLPVNSKGEPDYKYMEDYMKYLEQKKLLEYLKYIN